MSKNKHIDLEDIEDNVNINDFDDNVILDNSTELSVLESSSSMTKTSTEDNTSLGNNNKGKEKTTLAIWKYMYKKYDNMKQVVVIICNLCKKSMG